MTLFITLLRGKRNEISVKNNPNLSLNKQKPNKTQEKMGLLGRFAWVNRLRKKAIEQKWTVICIKYEQNPPEYSTPLKTAWIYVVVRWQFQVKNRWNHFIELNPWNPNCGLYNPSAFCFSSLHLWAEFFYFFSFYVGVFSLCRSFFGLDFVSKWLQDFMWARVDV